MAEGWVKIHRALLDWEWYQDIPVKVLFIHLLLDANHKDGKWKGHLIKRGQVLTGRIKLAEETGLSEKQIRTALKKLEKSGDLAIKAATKFSIITICNYDKYQDEEKDKGQQQGQQGANKGPEEGQQGATNKNEKKKKNGKNVEPNPLSSKPDSTPYAEVIQYLNEKAGKKFRQGAATKKLIKARFSEGFTLEDFKWAIDNQTRCWKGDAKMEEYLRPTTLFNASKFDGYVNNTAGGASGQGSAGSTGAARGKAGTSRIIEPTKNRSEYGVNEDCPY